MQLNMVWYSRGFIKFLCERSVGFFRRAFLVFLIKESKKRRQKQPGKLMAKSCSQPVNLPGAWPLMNPLVQGKWVRFPQPEESLSRILFQNGVEIILKNKTTCNTHHHLLHEHQLHIATSILRLPFYQILISEKKNPLYYSNS